MLISSLVFFPRFDAIGFAHAQGNSVQGSGSGAGDAERFEPAAAALTIVKNVDQTTISAPTTLTYTIVLSNVGDLSLTGVVVTDPLTGGAVYQSGDNGNGLLDVGENWVYSATYDVTQDVIDNEANILNEAFAQSSETGEVSDQAITIILQSPSITLAKDGTYVDNLPVGIDNAGDQVSYTFTITNAGNVTLTNVYVDDPAVTVFGSPIPSMAPGAMDSNTFTGSYTLTQDDIDAGGFTNTATVFGFLGFDDYTDNDSDTQTFTQSPSITLAKEGSYVDNPPMGVDNPGDQISYTFTITNTGNVTLTDVSVDDPVAIVTGSPIPSMAPGAVDSSTFTGSYTLTQDDIDAGSFTNTATVSGFLDAAEYTNDDSDTQMFAASPGLELTKTGTLVDNPPMGTVNLGDLIEYTFSVENTGNVPLENVSVKDPRLIVIGGPLPSLAPGASDTTTFTGIYAITQADIDGGIFTNTATAAGTYDGHEYTDVDFDTQLLDPDIVFYGNFE